MTLCHICEEFTASYSCTKCGRKVCKHHYDVELELCSVCKDSLCAICRSNLAMARCILCGRLGCNECLVEIDNVRRICTDCAVKYGINKAIEDKLNIIPVTRPEGPIKLARLIPSTKG